MGRDRSADIAVTGLFARFPGSSSVEEWWSQVKAGRVSTRRYTRDELVAAGVPAALVDDPDYVPARGHLDGADHFDNVLFRVSPRDAELMDPQHRLMLEVAWAALEDAGAGLQDGGTTAVFASGSGSGYLRSMLAGGPLDPLTLDQALHGTEPDFIASLISYKLDLGGPAIAVQTACSSSLVAVHLAVQALLSGDCDRALVVGAGIAFPQAGHLHVPGGIHSAAGRCRPFDASADGVVAGSGVACVVLRRLADAIAEGADPYGVILGSAVNNDAGARAGYYAPSGAGQEAVICAALGAADVDGSSIGYLETHGTGTRVGDPIEWSAATAALERMGAGPGQVAVGALKANVGHLDSAAGVAALIKALFVVKEGVIPPVAGFTRPNPLLDVDGSPLFVPAVLAPWTGPEPRRAGVSAFGIGGTNVHVIVEQPPLPSARPRAAGSPRLVALSAADIQALARSAARLGHHLAAEDPELASVSFTLAGGRVPLYERLAVVGRSSAEAAERLASGLGVARGRVLASGPAPAIFLFPGQGSQYPGMGLPFAEALPGFSGALDECLGAFDPELAARLRRALLDPAFPAEELEATALAQPALFAVEYAAAAALSAVGLMPAAVVGHSLGEITAACVAGILDLADAARFVTARGRAMQACGNGAMLALGSDEGQACALIAESGLALELAAVNAPDSCVVAGSVEEVEAFQSLVGERLYARRLRANRAFHSRLIAAAVPELARALAGIELRRPAMALGSNVTGQVIPAHAPVPPDLFAEQARRTVRFADALAAVADRVPGAITVEVGPGRTLSTFAQATDRTAVPLVPGRVSQRGDEVLSALGSLWTLGQPLALAKLCREGRPIHLPTYPFAGPPWLAAELVGARRRRTTGAGERSEPVAAAAVPEEPCLVEMPDPSGVLAGLWSGLLGCADPTDDSDFFELGGDSLLMVNLARRIKEQLGIQVPLRAMVAARTLGRQARVVRDLLTPAREGVAS